MREDLLGKCTVAETCRGMSPNPKEWRAQLLTTSLQQTALSSTCCLLIQLVLACLKLKCG